MPLNHRYSDDVLAEDWRRPARGRTTAQPATTGLVVEDAQTGFCGEIVLIENGIAVLEDRHLKRRAFPLGPGFLLDGTPVELVVPPRSAPKPTRTRSGSTPVRGEKAKVALPSRMWVEGRHDAELVEKIWGDDLRVAGVAVEFLGGIDDLIARVDAFDPQSDRRLGILVDHLVPGSKESRIADQLTGRPHVLVVGHPFVDVWQSIKPERLGVDRWPVIERGVEWKHGVCEVFGWPHSSQADIAHAWQYILKQARFYTDVEPALLGRVEELIDFLTTA